MTIRLLIFSPDINLINKLINTQISTDYVRVLFMFAYIFYCGYVQHYIRSICNSFRTLIDELVGQVLGHLNVFACVWDGVVSPLKNVLLRMPLEAVNGERFVFHGGHILYAVIVGGRRDQMEVLVQTQIVECLQKDKNEKEPRMQGRRT